MNCDYSSECKHGFSTKCMRCTNQSLWEPKKKQKNANSTKLYKRNEAITQGADDSWKDLEEKVATMLNSRNMTPEARRTRASGALPFEKGDVLDAVAHIECKERTGKELKSGDKSMSIHKDWLEKALEEARSKHKPMILPFRFKNDDQIYAIATIEDIIDLINIIKDLREGVGNP